jgi:transcriptional regulator NrdR family protein
LGVCLRTLSRWDTYEELEFPKPIVVKGRKYRDADQYEKWKRKRAVLSARERNASARERA